MLLSNFAELWPDHGRALGPRLELAPGYPAPVYRCYRAQELKDALVYARESREKGVVKRVVNSPLLHASNIRWYTIRMVAQEVRWIVQQEAYRTLASQPHHNTAHTALDTELVSQELRNLAQPHSTATGDCDNRQSLATRFATLLSPRRGAHDVLESYSTYNRALL